MRSRVLFIFIFFILLPTASNAAYKYIKVTSTKEPDQLWVIKAKLNNMGLSMIPRQTKKAYIVYSGPFISNASALSALKLVKPVFKHAHIIGMDPKTTLPPHRVVTPRVDLNESDEIILTEVQEEPTLMTQEPEDEEVYDGFFLGVSFGMSYAPYTLKAQYGVVILNTPSDYASNYALEIGYRFENDLFTSVEYMRVDSSDITMDSILVSLNYQLLETKYAPYLGVSLGHSMMTRDHSPIANVNYSDVQSESLIGGFNFGLIYNDYESLKPYIAYSYLMMDHKASLITSTGKSTLEHTKLHNLKIGVRF